MQSWRIHWVNTVKMYVWSTATSVTAKEVCTESSCVVPDHLTRRTSILRPPLIFWARGKRRDFGPGAAARHSQHARAQGRAAAEGSSPTLPRAHWIGPEQGSRTKVMQIVARGECHVYDTPLKKRCSFLFDEFEFCLHTLAFHSHTVAHTSHIKKHIHA